METITSNASASTATLTASTSETSVPTVLAASTASTTETSAPTTETTAPTTLATSSSIVKHSTTASASAADSISAFEMDDKQNMDSKQQMQEEQDNAGLLYHDADASSQTQAVILKDNTGEQKSKKQKVQKEPEISTPVTAYNELIKIASNAYKGCIKRKTGNKEKSNTMIFQVLEDVNGNWTEITDTTIIQQLTLLKDGYKDYLNKSIGDANAKPPVASYTFTGESYTATIGVDVLITSSADGSFATQTNVNTGVKRDLRCTSVERYDLLIEDSYKILFGPSPIRITSKKMDEILSKFNFMASQEILPSYELAELAQLLLDINQMNFKYVNGKDRQCKCELYIKPGALYYFMNIGKSRNYAHMRLVMHGCDKTGYDGIRDDFTGPNLAFDSKSNAKGPGFYCGLSYDVVTQYNREAPGTGIMALIWTNKIIDKNHGSYENYNLFSPDGSKNALVVHEPSLILILGKVVPL